MKTGLAKISTHSTSWQFKTIKLVQREKGGHWIYKLGTLAPYGLNENDGQVLLFKTKSVGYAHARANLRIFCSLLSDVTSF